MKRFHYTALSVVAAAVLAGCSAGSETASQATAPEATTLPTTQVPQAPSQTLPDGTVLREKTVHGVPYVSIAASLSDVAYNRMKADASTMDPSQREAYGKLVLTQWLSEFGTKYDVTVTDTQVFPRYGYAKAFIPKSDFLRIAAASQGSDVMVDEGNFAKHHELLSKTLTVTTPVPAAVAAKHTSAAESLSDLSEMSAAIAAERVFGFTPSRAAAKSIAGHVADENEGFSGLKAIKVKEFEDAVVKRLRTVPTGERVTVGVVDTGISYGHLGYTGADGKTARIKRMGEFSGEGTIYFNPAATMKAEPAGVVGADDMLKLTFDYYAARRGPSKPNAEELVNIAGVVIKPTPELAAALKVENTTARGGVFSEGAYQVLTPDGKVKEGIDINQNGKTNDNLLVIMVPSQNEAGQDTSTLYMSLLRPPLGNVPPHYDFTPLAAVRDFNASLSYIDLFAARFGFQIQPNTLNNAAGQEVAVHSAAMVGVDPGLHGSHVSGIIGARKTFINDSNNTKARGVAPLTQLQMNRVCANSGGCVNIDKAWIDLAKAGVDIINVSLGGLPLINDGYSPLEDLVNRITQEHDVLFAISAGNAGSGYNTTGSPSNALMAVSVAATATPAMVQAQRQLPGTGNGRKLDQDFVLYFSSRGPTGAGGFKPDLAAPGTEISIFPGNNNPVESSGSGWMHGTSMSAPTFAGAAALFLDAVRLYNEKNPSEPLPSDALTLRQVLTGSARPFGLAGHEKTQGTGYLWVDQGTGMVDLKAAWDAIFKLRDSKIPSPVWGLGTDGVKQLIDLVYDAKIIYKGPNGHDYKGGDEKLFARGLWLDYKSQDKVYAVNISRNITGAYKGELNNPAKTLAATFDRFAIKTRIDGVGKDIPWLKVGVLNQTDCEKSKTKASVSVHGKGMVAAKTKNDPLNSFYVCVNRTELAKLPAGEHGAVIELYKTSVDGEKMETLPSLKVPVFVAIPEKKLANAEGFALKGTVAGYLSQKRYIDVPEGVSAVEVTISVPEAKVTAKNTQGCSYILTNIYEADNKSAVPELSARDWVRNCTDRGAPEADASLRTVTYTRNNPKPGIWVFDLTGHGTVLESAFEMTVEYAAVKADVAKLDKLSGSFNFDFVLSTKSKPDTAKSLYAMLGMEQVQRIPIAKDPSKRIPVPPKGTDVYKRIYDAAQVKKVVFTTGNTKAPDVDLGLLACPVTTEDLNSCQLVGDSTSPTSDERVVMLASQIKPGHYYVPFVVGYNITGDSQEFDFTEEVYLVDEGAIDAEKDANELGELTLTAAGERYKVDYALSAEKAAKSRVLTAEAVKSGKFTAFGTLMVAAADGFKLLTLPVKLPAPAFTAQHTGE